MSNEASSQMMMMERIGKVTLKDESTLEHWATIDIGVTIDKDNSLLLTGLQVIIQIDDNEHWRQIHDLPRRRELMAYTLHSLACDIKKRFLESDRARDLEIAISLDRKALELTPRTPPSYPRFSSYLADTLQVRYDHSGQITDLDTVIALRQQAVIMTLPSIIYPATAWYLSDLADALGKRYNKLRKPEDLDEAIIMRMKFVELVPLTSEHRFEALMSLGNVLAIQHGRNKQDSKSLDDLIECYREAVVLASLEDTEASLSTACLRDLAKAVLARFKLSNSAADLQESIDLHQEVLKRQTESDPFVLENLAILLKDRFKRSGETKDLDHSISLWFQLADLHLSPHPDRYRILIGLAGVLQTQFVQTGQVKYLDDAIAFLREAVSLTPLVHHGRPNALNSLSMALRERFEELKRQDDLREAMELENETLKLDPTHVTALVNLGAILWSQYDPATGTEAELARIISLSEEAMRLLPPTHPNYFSLLNNLGTVLRAQTLHEANHQQSITRAVRMLEEALNSLDQMHPFYCVTSLNMGMALFQMSHITKDSALMDKGAAAYRRAATHPSAPISTKFQAATKWSADADRFDHSSGLEAYRTAISLLPQLAALNADITLRKDRLMSTPANGLAIDAAGYALRQGMLAEAIEFLEEGRAVFWSQAMRLRSPMGELEAVHPELAGKLKRLGKELETGSFADDQRGFQDRLIIPPGSEGGGGMMHEHQHLGRLRGLNAEWERTLQEVRQIPGFQDFLRRHRLSALQTCVVEGPVIILCVGNRNGDALIITANEVKHLPLADIRQSEVWRLAKWLQCYTTTGNPREKFLELVGAERFEQYLEHVKATERMDNVRSESTDARDVLEILEQSRYGKMFSKPATEKQVWPTTSDILKFVTELLWVKIMEPIVRFLQLKKSSTPLHVHWCPTGLLTLLPIHAAGLYEGPAETRESVSDYVVSSYIPTIGALLNWKDTVSTMDSSESFRMLAICEAKTLPCALEEIRKIENHISTHSTVHLGGTSPSPATISEVLSHLSTASVVHFACHGKQDMDNPLESGLELEDGRLTVSKIMQQEMKNAQLAFLCACETAMGEIELPDESMHLGAALLAAGFKGVIATMWAIADTDGPKIADYFYGYLCQEGPGVAGGLSRPDTNQAARALHHAVQKLRSEDVPLARWVPFIHIGR